MADYYRFTKRHSKIRNDSTSLVYRYPARRLMDGSKLVASSLGYEKSPEDIQSLYNGGPARIEMMMLMSAGGPAAARTAEEWRASCVFVIGGF